MRASSVALLLAPVVASSLACSGLVQPSDPAAPIAAVQEVEDVGEVEDVEEVEAAEPAGDQTEEAKDPVLEDLLRYENKEAVVAAFGDAVGTVEVLENEVGDIAYPAIHVDTPQEVIFLMQPGTDHSNGLQIQRLDSSWVSKTGMRTGLGVEEVEALNGGPFTLSSSPEGLQVSDFRGGTLDGVGVTPYFWKDGDPYPDLDAKEVDFGYASDDPGVRAARLKVSLLFVY